MKQLLVGFAVMMAVLVPQTDTEAQTPAYYLRVDSAGITIPTGSFVTLDAATDAQCNYLDVLNAVAQPVLLSIGAGDSPINYVLPPSMPSLHRIKASVPRGVKLGAKSLGSAGSTGVIYINCLQ